MTYPTRLLLLILATAPIYVASSMLDSAVVGVCLAALLMALNVAAGAYVGRFLAGPPAPQAAVPGTRLLWAATAICLAVLVACLALKLWFTPGMSLTWPYTALREEVIIPGGAAPFGLIQGLAAHLLAICCGLWLIHFFAPSQAWRADGTAGRLAPVLAGIVLSIGCLILLTGSRTLLLLAGAVVFLGVPRLRDLFSPKALAAGAILATGVLALGLLRGIPIWQIIPFDGFVVGPHLLEMRIDDIADKADRFSLYLLMPGSALFSGLYISADQVANHLGGIDLLPYHFADIFWKRHQWVYVPELGNDFNSYYTGVLAVVIEGGVTVMLLCQLIGFAGAAVRQPAARIVLQASAAYFVLNLYKTSAFQSGPLSLLFLASLLLGAAHWGYLLRGPLRRGHGKPR